MLIAYAITLIVPLVILFFLYSYDTFGLQPRRVAALALAWGGLAYGMAHILERLIGSFTDWAVITLLVAPLVEEAFKAGFIGLLLGRGRLVNMVDGMSIGFETGLSFGMIENLVYLSAFTGTGAEAVGFAAARVLTSGLMHAFVAGMIGAVAGHSVRYRPRRQRLYFYGSILLAVLLHLIYNVVALRLDGTWLLLTAMAISLTGAGIIFLLLHREVRWVGKRVEMLRGQPSSAAQMAAANPQELRTAVARYKRELGPDIVQKLERFAWLIGQQSALRSALDDFGATRHREVLRVRLEEIEGQMAVLNADIGLFMRVWMSMLVASDHELLSAIEGTQLPTTDDPRLGLAVALARRTRILSPAELEGRKLALETSSIFGTLPPLDIEDVALMLDARYCTRGEAILRRGEPNEHSYLVAVGQFDLRIPSPDGGSVLTGRVRRGEVFGLASALGDHKATSDVVCTQEGLLFVLDYKSLLSLVYGNPRIGMVLMRHLSARVQTWGNTIQRMTAAERKIYEELSPGSAGG